MNILFVCAGNICRSPTAEIVFRSLLKKENHSADIRVASAGTLGYHVGEAPDKRMQKAAARRGYDLSKVRARQVCQADFASFDRILAMDSEVLRRLKRICPDEAADRLGLFMHYASDFQGDDIPDPYYGSPQDFDRVVELTERAAAGLLHSLR